MGCREGEAPAADGGRGSGECADSEDDEAAETASRSSKSSDEPCPSCGVRDCQQQACGIPRASFADMAACLLDFEAERGPLMVSGSPQSPRSPASSRESSGPPSPAHRLDAEGSRSPRSPAAAAGGIDMSWSFIEGPSSLGSQSWGQGDGGAAVASQEAGQGHGQQEQEQDEDATTAGVLVDGASIRGSGLSGSGLSGSGGGADSCNRMCRPLRRQQCSWADVVRGQRD